MVLTMKEVSKFDSLKNEKIVSGEEGLSNIVSGVMVMEAIDIEEWGHSGQILLTSHYAFENIAEEKILNFFKKSKEIGIAGFIFKKNRLVNEIPDYFLSQCKKYQLPLIEVNKNITYEAITNEILETLMNRNAVLLQSYYDNHQKFLQLMMNQAGVEKILDVLKTLIDVPVSLLEKIEGEIIGTDEDFNHFEIIDKKENALDEYNRVEYETYRVSYPNNDHDHKGAELLSFTIPNLGYEEFELLVHGGVDDLSDTSFMAVTNTIIAIQTELVKRYALRQNKKARINEMVSDLINGRLTQADDIEETINSLRMNPNSKYRVFIFSIKSDTDDLSHTMINRFTDTLANHFENRFTHVYYLARKKKISLITSTDKMDVNAIRRKIEIILDKLAANTAYQNMYLHASVSNEVTVYELSEGNRQATDAQKIMDIRESKSSIVFYESLGLYQLFVETDNLTALERFIPESITRLQSENPELLKTLNTFINVNQNYSEAADILFVHPKTVRYRVNRLKEIYGIEFNDPEEILRYSIAIRISKLLSKH